MGYRGIFNAARATAARNPRDISKLKLSGRSQEIQRLIGRALRSVVNLNLWREGNYNRL